MVSIIEGEKDKRQKKEVIEAIQEKREREDKERYRELVGIQSRLHSLSHDVLELMYNYEIKYGWFRSKI